MCYKYAHNMETAINMHIYRVEFLNIPKIFPRYSCYLFGLWCKIRPDSGLSQKEIRNCFSEFSAATPV